MRKGIVMALVTGATLAGLSSTAYAAVFTVTKTSDTLDGICDSDCSLREAISAANASPGSTVQIPGGVYRITRIGYDDTNAAGDFDISADMDILPITGTGTPIIDANGSATKARAFHVLAGVALVRFDDLQIINGKPMSPTNSLESGGGILNEGQAWVSGCTFINDEAANGGAIHASTISTQTWVFDSSLIGNRATWGGGIHSSGILYLSHTQVSGNVASVRGGGIHMNQGDVVSCVVEDNQAAMAGGGIAIGGVLSAGRVTLYEVDVVRNVVTNGPGGGIHALDNVDLWHVEVVLNEAHHDATTGAPAGQGGGIWSEGDLTLSDNCRVTRNVADRSGGGIFATGLAHPSWGPAGGSLTIYESDISDSTSSEHGGGIYATEMPVSILQTTISGNEAAVKGGGIMVQHNVTLWVENSTIALNWAKSTDGGGGLASHGGAQAPTSVDLYQVTIANNAAGPTRSQDHGILHTVGTLKLLNSIHEDDCSGSAAPITSSGHNVVINAACGGGLSSDRVVPPSVGAGLLIAGGYPFMYSLASTSPALSLASGCPATDQRGVSRSPTVCDSGAYEAP